MIDVKNLSIGNECLIANGRAKLVQLLEINLIDCYTMDSIFTQ